jgi:mxaK protein
MEWRRIDAINSALTLLMQNQYVDADQVNMQYAEVRFAYAGHLHQLGFFEEAVDAYSKAERDSPPELLKNIYYNMGNLYLQQAIKLAEGLGIDRATALADVSKEMYESALKVDPHFWNAKFNLEAAQRVSRDLPLGKLNEDTADEDSSAELWSAMPGFPVGLP